MKTVFLLCVIVLGNILVSASITLSNFHYPNACVAGNTQCAVTGLTATVAGDAIVFGLQFSNVNDTVVSVADNATGGSNSYVCGTRVWDVSAVRGTQVCYSITARSGATSVTATVQGGSGLPTNSTIRLGAIELAPGSGNTLAFETWDAKDNTSACGVAPTLCAGVSLSLSAGANVAIVQTLGANGGGIVSVSSPYTNRPIQASFGWADVANVNSSTTGLVPDWTTNTANRSVAAAIAIREVTSAPSVRRRVMAHAD